MQGGGQTLNRVKDEAGFTLIELLTAIALFSVVSTGFYQVMFASSEGSQTAQDVIHVSEEARLGLNRIVRDAREANAVRAITRSATGESFELWIDFDNDNIEDSAPADLTGSHEIVTYTWSSSARTISIRSGGTTEVLMEGIDCVERTGGLCVTPVFGYSSSRLEYDVDPADGTTSVKEIDAADGLGDGNFVAQGAYPFPNGSEADLVDGIAFALKVTQGDATGAIYTEAQLRNRR